VNRFFFPPTVGWESTEGELVDVGGTIKDDVVGLTAKRPKDDDDDSSSKDEREWDEPEGFKMDLSLVGLPAPYSLVKSDGSCGTLILSRSTISIGR